MKSKKVLTILLSLAIMLTFMPVMAFADDGDVSAAAATPEAFLTTAKTTTPIEYATLGDAISAANGMTTETDITITLNKDVTVTGTPEVRVPLTIDLNEHELTESARAQLSPNKGQWGPNWNRTVCRQDTETSIVFATHETTRCYNWTENSDHSWSVTSEDEVCDNCGKQRASRLSGNMLSSIVDQTGTTYRYGTGSGSRVTVLSTYFVAASETPAYTVTSGPTVRKVGNVVQRIDGAPVFDATIRNSDSYETTDVLAAVTPATDAEIEGAKATGGLGIKALDSNTDVTSSAENSIATCKAPAKTIFKVQVVDPDGNVLVTQYRWDTASAPKTDHEKGRFAGIQYVVKNSQKYMTEDAVIAAAEAAGDNFVRYEYDEVTQGYYLWVYKTESGRASVVTDVSSPLTIDPYALSADKKGFSYRPVFYCVFDFTTTHADGFVFGELTEVTACDNATTNAEYKDGAHSQCETWVYPVQKIKSEYYATSTSKTKSTDYTNVKFASEGKVREADYSHVKSGDKYAEYVEATCATPGKAHVDCPICLQSSAFVPIPTLAHHIVVIPDSKINPTTGAVTVNTYVDGTEVFLSGIASSDKKTATVAPTCTVKGGVYEYCDGTNNKNHPHFVLKEELAPTGHDLNDREAATGTWAPLESGKLAAVKEDGSLVEDVTYRTTVVCKNETGLPATKTVVYHTKAGKDGIGTDGLIHKYSAISKSGEPVGSDCQHKGEVTFTVDSLKTATNTAIKEKAEGIYGPHSYKVNSFGWSRYYDKATASVECTVKNCTSKVTKDATVEKSTAASGLTTYKATYGDASESKEIFTFEGGELSFDESAITDGNLIVEKTGVAQQVPDVTVTINDTVIDSDSYQVAWTYNSSTKVATATATWKSTTTTGHAVDRRTAYTSVSKSINVGAKTMFNGFTPEVKYDGKVITSGYSKPYDPAKAFDVAATARDSAGTVEDATVKYAISDEEVVAGDGKTKQENIEALDFSYDEVKGLKNVGTYYVYAQASKDGYTTYTSANPVATLTVTAVTVVASIDNFTMRQGENPEFNMSVVEKATGKVIDYDKSEFKVTSVGGQELHDLIPGDYALLVTSENYIVETSSIPGRVGTVTVLTKDGKTPEEEAKAAAEAADKALADAGKITTDAYTADSVKKVQEAQAALKAVLAKTPAASTEEVEAATAALNDAIAKAVALKANDMKVKVKKVKAKVGKKKTKKAVIVTGAEGTVTIKKANKAGGKKIVVKNNGKIVVKKGLKKGTYKVKVTVTAAGDTTHKAMKVTKTVKVVVKK
jgi:hypothetical protein